MRWRIGAAGHDAAEPLGTGLAKGWRGRIAFQALRGLLPGGSELQPVSGVVKSDGQSLTFDAIKGKIGGGEVDRQYGCQAGRERHCAERGRYRFFRCLEGRRTTHYRNLAIPAATHWMPDGAGEPGPQRLGAERAHCPGGGTLMLEERPRWLRLDPRAFEAAVPPRARSGSQQAEGDSRLKQIVEVRASGWRVYG